MVLGAAQKGKRDYHGLECRYCHKMNHIEKVCYKKQRDIKEGRYQPNQRRPLPEGKKHTNATRQAQWEDNEPQTAIRLTKLVAMSRSGYDMPARINKNEDEQELDQGPVRSWVGRTAKPKANRNQ